MSMLINAGKAVKEVRNKKKMTQADLAEAVGVTPTTICLIEKGQKNPSTKTSKKIAKALGTHTFILNFMALEEKDVKPEKREAFRIMRPAIMNLIKSTFDEQ